MQCITEDYQIAEEHMVLQMLDWASIILKDSLFKPKLMGKVAQPHIAHASYKETLQDHTDVK